ncbi:hypothetical protein M9Y10_029511 [Tritrichomonas musculus]|uniref:Microbial-type PARG catalytic domain-containing protein n=1 Tax=Tritrichomonas musculus TaxID=1915356 RepID=A0ABR2KMJ4_9EUKA
MYCSNSRFCLGLPCSSCCQKRTECQSNSSYQREEAQRRKTIVDKNHQYAKSYPFLIDHEHVQTICDFDHDRIPKVLGKPNYKFPYIYVENCSSAASAIYNHKQHPKSNICILNSTDSLHPGGGYLRGLDGKEEVLCRQSLLYPTLEDSEMYEKNRACGNKIDGSDEMAYSPNVYVFRDDLGKELVHPFKVNVISATAISNKWVPFYNGPKIMERRIRKMICLAAYKKNDILILNDYGCGEYKNDPTQVAKMFHKVLVTEGMKNYFSTIVFSIYHNKVAFEAFQSVFKNK